MNNYEDILYLPHHISKKRKPMSLEKRSAQFAPFSALTGYEEELEEVSRLTTKKIELTEEAKELINQKLQWLLIHKEKLCKIIYFEKDKKKRGGSYLTISDTIKKIDSINHVIETTSAKQIPIENIVKIEFLTYNDFIK